MNQIEQMIAALPAAVALLAHNGGLATPLSCADVAEAAYQLMAEVHERIDLDRPANEACKILD